MRSAVVALLTIALSLGLMAGAGTLAWLALRSGVPALIVIAAPSTLAAALTASAFRG